ncbi:desert hedgehog protein B-like [Gigantopelta aegis]|uniref:desert hedgehog protein B-like n=1 Tax=Gigantopelta aegis TaxID=1735272 RepID=UPI001B889675|nr:desert hedgehog protein B-like [Gigantopelta aegis]
MHFCVLLAVLGLFIAQFYEAKSSKSDLTERKRVGRATPKSCDCILNGNRYVQVCQCGCVDHIAGQAYKPCCTICDCFPGDARLLLDNGNVVVMKDLRSGYRILTVKDGRRVFSEVKTFLHRQPYKNTTYLTLTTDQGNLLTMTGNHLLFASTNNQSTGMEARPASSVKKGDYIFSAKSCPRGLCPERVVQISFSTKQGLYVPVTDEGTLVVDGMFASCYSFIEHDFAHLAVFLFRSFPWILQPWQHDGFSPILSGLQSLGTVILPNCVLRLG